MWKIMEVLKYNPSSHCIVAQQDGALQMIVSVGETFATYCLCSIGSDFTSNNNLDVPTQVDLLIKQATSHENLCQCYIGW